MFTESNCFSGQTKAQADIIAYWRRMSPGDAIPRRADIDPGTLRSHLSAISIVEIEPDGGIRFRLAGSQVRSVFGQEMRGRRLQEFSGEAADMWALGLTAVLDKSLPVGGLIERADDCHAWLRLPLSPERGSALILCHDMIMPKRVMAPVENRSDAIQSDRLHVLAA